MGTISMTHVPATPRKSAFERTRRPALAQMWGTILLRGFLALAFGTLVLLAPEAALAATSFLFTVFVLADGVCVLVSAVRAAKRDAPWLPLALQGVLHVLLAAAAFLSPAMSTLAFVWLLAAWALASGICALVTAARLTAHHGRGLLVLVGAVAIAWSAWMAIAPVPNSIGLALRLGLYALFLGASLVALSGRLRRQLVAGGA
jgi:uncharacterized membrane protein HdeD (DUF308 family)